MSNAPHLKVNSKHAHHLLGILSGNPPDGIVYHSVSRGQPESFFNLDLPIKYAPDPELHGLKWRHKPQQIMPRLNHLKGDVQRCQTQTQQVQHQFNMHLYLFISIIFKSKTHTFIHYNVSLVTYEPN